MGNYDFQNDFQNDAARRNYEAAMNGKRRNGVDFFEKPYTWDEERPIDIKDTPITNFVPIPVPSTGGFADYSPLKKVLVIAGIVAAVALLGWIAYTFIMDGGFKYMGFGSSFW